MSDRHLLFEIVDTLETEGLGRDEYQLQRVIDVEALEQLVDSANDDLEILETLHLYKRATLTAIANEVGVSKSTVHRHLRTLRNRRFVTKVDDEYVLGLEFLRFGGAARERYSFHRQSKAIVQQVANQTGEFVVFLVEDQGVGTFLYCEMETEGVPVRSSSRTEPPSPPVRIRQSDSRTASRGPPQRNTGQIRLTRTDGKYDNGQGTTPNGTH